MTQSRIFSLFFALIVSPVLAFGWADMGHKMVGAIAEETMSKDAKDLVRGILGIEPLAVSSIWPDHVRDDSRFGTRTDPAIPESAIHDFSPFHFCEIPVGFNYTNKPKKVEKDCFSVMKQSIEILKDINASREMKMIALRFLIHVVGDIHQPLHVGNGYDRGGNACQVKFQKSPEATEQKLNFHSFWDETIVDYVRESFADADRKIKAPKYFGDFFKAMKTKHSELLTEEAKMKYAAGELTDWLSESQALRDTIYPDPSGSMDQIPKGEEYKNRPYCLWYVNQDFDKKAAPGSVIVESKIPLLTSDYMNRFAPTVELQLFKGGLRLASMLDKVALEMKKKKVNRVDDKKQEEILKGIQDKLKNIF